MLYTDKPGINTGPLQKNRAITEKNRAITEKQGHYRKNRAITEKNPEPIQKNRAITENMSFLITSHFWQ